MAQSHRPQRLLLHRPESIRRRGAFLSPSQRLPAPAQCRPPDVFRLLDAQALPVDGVRGGYEKKEPYLIAGDLNASPEAPVEYDDVNAINQLLLHPKIFDPFHDDQSSRTSFRTAAYTAKFGEDRLMRIDYLLPSRGLNIVDRGVFWPERELDNQGFELAEKASDHRLVWIDITFYSASFPGSALNASR